MDSSSLEVEAREEEMETTSKKIKNLLFNDAAVNLSFSFLKILADDPLTAKPKEFFKRKGGAHNLYLLLSCSTDR